MKSNILFALLMLATLLASGQDFIDKNGFIKITTANHVTAYSYAKDHAYSTNLDSVAMACRIFERLHIFDSLFYSSVSLLPFLTNAQNNIASLLSQQLQGSWRKKWDISFAGFCGDISNYEGDQVIRFTGDSMFVYDKTILKEKHRYTILKKFGRSLYSVRNSEVVADNGNRIWRFYIYDKHPFEPDFKFTNAYYLEIMSDGNQYSKFSAIYVKPFAL